MKCKVCNHDHNDTNRPWCDRSDLEIERDQLRAEVEKLKHELYNRIPIRIESPEYNELKAQCEKLVKALEKYANPETHSMDKDGEVWYGDYFDYETAQNALAEYRKANK